MPRSVASAATVLALLLAAPALAHDTQLETEGNAVEVAVDSLAFAASGDAITPGAHNPQTGGLSILVRGTGASASRSEVISLDQAVEKWSFTEAEGYTYTDLSGSAGGITGATYKAGEITITAGSGWSWAPAGELDALWVHVLIDDQWYCTKFDPLTANATANAAGYFAADTAPVAPEGCPDQICGNAEVEQGEACDDGNAAESDGCTSVCEIGECVGEEFDTTFEALEQIVFAGCTDSGCHNSGDSAGNLDLTTAVAYSSLLGEDLQGEDAFLVPSKKRVVPTEPELSFLYQKLAANTLGLQVEGTSMPTGGRAALSPEHLQAVRMWIRGGAPLDRVVEGTAELLDSCLPPPDPLIVPIPDPPPAGVGVQVQQTARSLPQLDESEICMGTYYDMTDLVPEGARITCPERYAYKDFCDKNANHKRDQGEVDCSSASCAEGICTAEHAVFNPEGECFSFKRTKLVQDPQSHHEIIYSYTGGYDTDHEGWGDWTYKFRASDPSSGLNGTVCDPKAVAEGFPVNPGCSSEAKPAVACIRYGPPDFGQGGVLFSGGGTTPQIMISQEPYSDFSFTPGAFDYLPMKGMVIWNSHAFNLTPDDSTMSSFLNFDFATGASERRWPIEKVFDFASIFTMTVPAFETREYCTTFTFPQDSQLFRLSSHMHQRGVLFRIWAPPNELCKARCAPGDHAFCGLLDQRPIPACDGPPSDVPMYYSPDYSDPVEMRFEPPVSLDSEDEADRTYLYCAQYDNGSTEDSPPVKLFSTSPAAIFGGPCDESQLTCANPGATQGEACSIDEQCDNGDAQDGSCDACPVVGGITTEDEMMAIFTDFFIPEPSSRLLALAALGALAALRRRESVR